ncbi:SSH4 family protein [Sporobolomyces salmoneus]|uniref:SSH4 family protein n=1 Tax=Sporobolomyces salmoneus TaxID=183962 RepID=UPI0031765BA4
MRLPSTTTIWSDEFVNEEKGSFPRPIRNPRPRPRSRSTFTTPSSRLEEFIRDTLLQDGSGDGGRLPQWPLPSDGGDEGGGGGNFPTSFPPTPPDPPSSRDNDATLAIVIPLIIVLTTLLFLIFLLIILLLKRRRGIVLSDENGPTNLEREDLVDGEGGFQGVESRWLQQVEEPVRIGYQRAKDWQTQYPPNSQPTEITLSQFLSIQEKGVSAWSFEPDYESNPALIVQSRTEITFLADGFGMAPEEGGGCNVQSNLPLPKLNEVYYWEAKMFEKPQGTNVAIGLATKPFPSFRLPGWNRFSVGYHSSDGFKSHNYPFTSSSYGPPLLEGDTLGVGYRPRTGTVFFTRNGKRLEDAFIGFNKHNLFPTVGADGACSIHVNLGQAGFVFIEANVKKWGLAPMVGSLAPPPAYGSERGSILLESSSRANANQPGASTSSRLRSSSPSTIAQQRLLPHSPPTRSHRSRRGGGGRSNVPTNLPPTAAGAATALASPSQPIRPSPLRHSRHASNLSNTTATSENGSNNGGTRSVSPVERSDHNTDGREHEGEDEEDIHNPPTPGLLDISLHSIHRFPDRVDESDEDDTTPDHEEEEDEEEESDEEEGDGFDAEQTLEQRLLREVARERGETESIRSVSPPAYHPIDPHMYAPGVAETILEDAFSNPSSSSPSSTTLPSSSRHLSSSSAHRTSAHESRSNSFLAQLGLGFGSGSGGAIRLPDNNSSLSPFSTGSSSPLRYEGRTGRGGIGNFNGNISPAPGQPQQAGNSAQGAGSWLGWLSGSNHATA